MIAIRRAAALLLPLFVWCQSSVLPETEMQDMQKVQTSTANADNQFGIDLFKAVAAGDKNGNVLISPLSVAMALQMTANGAAGQTRDQMLSAMKLHDGSLAQINGANHYLLGQLTAREKDEHGRILEIANAVFVNAGAVLQKATQEVLEHDYQAKLESVPFGQPEALTAINGFVSERTHAKIEKILDSTNAMMRLVLVNAVYFKGLWEDPFNIADTVDKLFHAPGGEIKTPTMHRRQEMDYFEDGDGLQAVALPYADGHTRMVVILPAEGQLAAFESGLDYGKLQGILRSLRSRKGSLAVPKFKISWGAQLNAVLQQLGMKDAFNASVADFSRFIDSKERLFISIVMHKTYMDFNEQGTEAAAATGVGVTASMARMPEAPFNMVVDRPFFIALEDLKTGSLVFFGRISNPQK